MRHGFQIATACLGFTIIPAIWGSSVWWTLPESFRWTVFASQVLTMSAGYLMGRIIYRRT